MRILALLILLIVFASPLCAADLSAVPAQADLSATRLPGCGQGAQVEPTLAELGLQAEILKERSARMNAEFERGKLQIEAGTLRQGLAIQGDREVKTEEAALKAKIEELKKQTQKDPHEKK